MRNIKSGSTVIWGMPGIKLRPKPATTKNIGYEILIRCPSMTSIRVPKRRERMRSRSFCILEDNLLVEFACWSWRKITSTFNTEAGSRNVSQKRISPCLRDAVVRYSYEICSTIFPNWSPCSMRFMASSICSSGKTLSITGLIFLLSRKSSIDKNSSRVPMVDPWIESCFQ